MRSNQKKLSKSRNIFLENQERESKRYFDYVESSISQLCNQFKIRNNYAKSFNGFKNRILSKITALTFIQFVNVFIFN